MTWYTNQAEPVNCSLSSVVEVIFISSTTRGGKCIRAGSSSCSISKAELSAKPSRLLQGLSKCLIFAYVSITHTPSSIFHRFLEMSSLNFSNFLLNILLHGFRIFSPLPFPFNILLNIFSYGIFASTLTYFSDISTTKTLCILRECP
uniref:Uncharacterized protein n=1 Tax=Opuntia streptacantha TaxID=393608 RepID=A0A7C9A5V2_OPUST